MRVCSTRMKERCMKHTYVLDSNVLLSDPLSLTAFEDNTIIIPFIVLEELDAHKSRQDEVGRNARSVNRALDELRDTGSLTDGVILPSGGTIRVVGIDKSARDSLNIPVELKESKADNIIIVTMMCLKEKHPDAVLVTRDINVRVKCDALGLKSEDYRQLHAVTATTDFYTGVSIRQVDEEMISELHDLRECLLPDAIQLHQNEIAVLKNHSSASAIARRVGNKLKLVTQHEAVYGLKPRNKEQNFSLELLLDPEIKLVSLTGPAGVGKSLISLAAGLEQLKTVGKIGLYDKLIITRSVQPVGKDLGFLPGTLDEKLEPWIAPTKDNLSFLMNAPKHPTREKKRTKEKHEEPYLSLLRDNGIIEIEALAFIRGRSISNAYILIEEAQNLSAHEVKTIITRAGDNTKVVLVGDVHQIDNPHLDIYTNGLTHVVERFKEHEIAGHITLIKGERSPLSTLASQIL